MKRAEALKILGLTGTPTPEVVRAAAKSAAQRWHPDKPGGDANKFNSIMSAKHLLARKVCTTCNGKKLVDVRNGAFVSRDQPCPDC